MFGRPQNNIHAILGKHQLSNNIHELATVKSHVSKGFKRKINIVSERLTE